MFLVSQALTRPLEPASDPALPGKPGMSRDDLFKTNASIVRDLVVAVAKYCPMAYVLVISNPVNSTVPIAAEILKKHNVFDPKKLFGVTTLDVVRAETFVGDITGEKDPSKLTIPVVGGHAGATIVPLFSQAKPSVNIPEDKLDALVNRVQFGGDEVVKAKDGAGSATLSMAFAGFRFAEALLKAKKGEKGVIEPTFVYLPGVDGGDEIQKATGCDYFSVPVELGVSSLQPHLLFILTVSSPTVRKRPSTSCPKPTTTRRSSLTPAMGLSRAASRPVSNSLPALPGKSFGPLLLRLHA